LNSGDTTLELELREFSDWVEWIKCNLASGGVDLPSEETCVLFAAASVQLANRVHRVCGHLPTSLRALLIQAAILHQCWTREVGLRVRQRPIAALGPKAPILDALDLVRKSRSSEYRAVASDGHRYTIKFPMPVGREMALATEVICFGLATEMGLPVPPVSLVRVDTEMAARAGVLRDWDSDALSSVDGIDTLSCFGVREIAEVEMGERGKLHLPMSSRTSRWLAGATVFHILTLNAIFEKQVFCGLKGRAEPIFRDFSHCLMDTDWVRFKKATYREPVAYAAPASKVKSYEQLEVWVRRIEQIDLQRICELVVKLPGNWYQNKPMSVAATIEKLGERILDLRRSILHLINTGYFTGIQKPHARRIRDYAS
jgi:hypothetical protein